MLKQAGVQRQSKSTQRRSTTWTIGVLAYLKAQVDQGYAGRCGRK
jgi:hypothetical protein